jgi:hypothetical protein
MIEVLITELDYAPTRLLLYLIRLLKNDKFEEFSNRIIFIVRKKGK